MAAVVMRRLSSSSTTSNRPSSNNGEAPLPSSGVISLSLCSARKLILFLLTLCSSIFQNRRVHLQYDRRNRTASYFARNFDAPAVLANDVLRHPQSEACALLTRREERIEDAGEIVLVYADAAIAQLHDDRRLQGLFVTRRGDGYLAAARNRLLGVDDQIEENLPQLVGA